MANKKTSSAQAIRDMLEAGLDITFFIGEVNRMHILNVEIGIVTKEKAVKLPKTPKVKKEKPKKISWKPRAVTPVRHRFNSNLTINPDGTVSLGFTSEWDYK